MGREICWQARFHQFGLEIEELIKVGEEKVVFIECGQTGPDRLKNSLDLLKGPVIHDHIADGDHTLNCLVGNKSEGSKNCQRRAGLGDQISQGPSGGNLQLFDPEPLS